KAVLFDSMRHFMFVLPLIAVVAAAVAEQGLVWLRGFPHRRLIWVALALYGFAHIGTMGMLHPNQYIYYNSFVGGVERGQRNFQLDYWAQSYPQAIPPFYDSLPTPYRPPST